MHITIEKTTKEQIEVKPGCYKDSNGFCCKVNSYGKLIRVHSRVVLVYEPGEKDYDLNVQKAINGHPITEIEFMKRFTYTQSQLYNIAHDLI